jgi:glc operon protein GlcG
MDGAPRFSADFAIAKARTAATFGAETSQLEALYADRPVFAQSFVAQGGYFLGGGGVPIVSAGTVIGAVGVSGSESHDEEGIARAAAQQALGRIER